MNAQHFADYSLPEAARLLGGEVSGGEIRCPGPGHTKDDRSLCIRPTSNHPRGFTAFTHSTADEDLDCADHVLDVLGIPKWQPKAYQGDVKEGFSGSAVDGAIREQREARLREAEAAQAKERAQKNERARMLLEKSVSPAGTLVEKYLRKGRSIPISDAMLLSCGLRFDQQHYHGGQKENFPAMIAPYRHVLTDTFQGIHRTYLDRQGLKKATRLSSGEQKKMFGSAKDAAIKLAAIDNDGRLGIAEGIETALTVMAHGWGPMWSVMSAQGIQRFPILDNVRSLTIFADAGEAGLSAAQECAARWMKAGRSVEIYAAHSDDFNSDVELSA